SASPTLLPRGSARGALTDQRKPAQHVDRLGQLFVARRADVAGRDRGGLLRRRCRGRTGRGIGRRLGGRRGGLIGIFERARQIRVVKRAVVKRMAPPLPSGIRLSIALSPKLLLPSVTARRLSCSAPTTSSASRAVPPLISTTSGRPFARSPGVALMRLAAAG